MSDDPTPTPDPTPEPDGKVLADQDKAALIATIAELRRERRDLRGKVEGYAQQLDTHATASTALNSQIESLKAEHAQKEAVWSDERAMLGAGLTDPEGQAVARALYGTLPDDGKPASIAEYLQAFGAENAKVPAGLAPYLGSKAAPTPKPAPAQRSAPAVGGNATDALLKAARESGNWQELARLTGMPWNGGK